MIIFLYGPDDYRREAKKREILVEFQKKRSDLGIGRFSFGEGSASGGDLAVLEKFREFLVSQSLFQSAKLAVLEDSFQVSGDRLKELKKMLQEVVENKNITVLMSEKDKPAKALDFLLKESVRQAQDRPVVNQNFENLEGKEWENFILKEAKRAEVKITAGALRFLVGVYQNSSWGLVTELEKLAGLSRELVDVKDLEELGVEQAPVFWSLIMGFKSRNLEQRLWALEKVLGSNQEPAKIFNILAYQLPEKLSDLANYDLMVKSGKIEYEEVLLNLAIE